MELSIDAASDGPGVALSVDGVVGLAATWRTERNHSVELLPNIERLLQEAGQTKDAISAVFVDIGPGGYAGLRVGVSIAKALAHALGVPLAGIGRLELEAYGVLQQAGQRRIVAVHQAGRGELAWAAYRLAGAWREEVAPRITRRESLGDAIEVGDVVVADASEDLADLIVARRAMMVVAGTHRVIALAALGARRLTDGRSDDPRGLVPLYLREPAIGPQA